MRRSMPTSCGPGHRPTPIPRRVRQSHAALSNGVRPLFRLIGERADIVVWLRLMMLPLYLVSLWAVFRLATILFSRKAAPWLMLCAALSP